MKTEAELDQPVVGNGYRPSTANAIEFRSSHFNSPAGTRPDLRDARLRILAQRADIGDGTDAAAGAPRNVIRPPPIEQSALRAIGEICPR
jgi:hypothetical protein